MKYIHTYKESIDFDDFDWEEEEPIDNELNPGDEILYPYENLKQGDIVKMVYINTYRNTNLGTQILYFIDYERNGNLLRFYEGPISPQYTIDYIEREMKIYLIKRIHESIDFDDFDWEEEDHISKEELMNYFILVDTDEECRIVAKKLVEMGFKVYNYDQLMRYGRSDGGVIIWRKLRYTGSSWTRSNSNIGTFPLYKEIDFKTFMELI